MGSELPLEVEDELEAGLLLVVGPHRVKVVIVHHVKFELGGPRVLTEQHLVLTELEGVGRRVEGKGLEDEIADLGGGDRRVMRSTWVSTGNLTKSIMQLNLILFLVAYLMVPFL